MLITLRAKRVNLPFLIMSHWQVRDKGRDGWNIHQLLYIRPKEIS